MPLHNLECLSNMVSEAVNEVWCLIQVFLTDNNDNLVLDVLKGKSDAALLRSDAIMNLQHRGLVNASDFQLIEAVSIPCC